MAKNQHMEDVRRIQELSTQNASLAKKLDSCKSEVARLMEKTSEKKTEPLTRSSIEAYIGLGIAIALAVFPMTWWMRIPLFIILCLVCADFCWRSPYTLKHTDKYSRFMLCLLVFGLLFWVGWNNVATAHRAESLPPEPTKYLKNWGALDNNLKIIKPPPPNVPFVQGTLGSRLIVDTTKLKNYSDRYRLWGACFHWDGTVDLLDTNTISHSNLFDINGTDTVIVISWNQQYLNEIIAGRTGTLYYILLVPKKVNKHDFKSIREALDSGASILEDAGGPP